MGKEQYSSMKPEECFDGQGHLQGHVQLVVEISALKRIFQTHPLNSKKRSETHTLACLLHIYDSWNEAQGGK